MQRSVSKRHLFCHVHVRSPKTGKEAWDALIKAFENKDISSRISLRQKLARINLNDSMTAYISEVVEVYHELEELGCRTDDEEIAFTVRLL